jgi:hypothetical protein
MAMAGNLWQSKIHLMSRNQKEKKEKGQVPQPFLTTSKDLPFRPHLLKIPPPPSHITLGTTPSAQGLLEDI